MSRTSIITEHRRHLPTSSTPDVAFTFDSLKNLGQVSFRISIQERCNVSRGPVVSKKEELTITRSAIPIGTRERTGLIGA